MALTVDALLVYLRMPGPGDELATLAQVVELANGVVEEVTGPLDVEPARVQAIRLEIAARAYRNPQGLTSETVDDYTWRGDPSGRAGVYLTDAEETDLVAAIVGHASPTAPWSGSLAYRR